MPKTMTGRMPAKTAQRQHGAMIEARYSTDNQHADSIEVQVEKCTEYCHKHSIPILGVYADYAVSGMKRSRPQHERMMQDLEAGIGDTVVVYDPSRALRNMASWLDFRWGRRR